MFQSAKRVLLGIQYLQRGLLDIDMDLLAKHRAYRQVTDNKMEKSNVDDDCDNTADAFVSSEKGITRMMMMIKHNREPGFLMILSTSLQVLLLFPLT